MSGVGWFEPEDPWIGGYNSAARFDWTGEAFLCTTGEVFWLLCFGEQIRGQQQPQDWNNERNESIDGCDFAFRQFGFGS